VKEIAAGSFSEGVYEQWAPQVARDNHLPNGFEVLAGLLFVPARAAASKWLQTEPRGLRTRMAYDTSRVAGAFRQENRLYFGFEKLEIERCTVGRWRNLLSAQQTQQQGPANKQL
jgi:hypothetical protein